MEVQATIVGGRGGPVGPAGGSMRLLVVRCGRYRLGFPSALVRGVVAPDEIVPLELPGLEGLIWRDGALIPATRLGPRLGLPVDGAGGTGHGVLLRSEEGVLCLMVDEALDLIEVPEGAVVALPSLVRRAVPLQGVESVAATERLLLIVDPVRLLGRQGVADLMAAAEQVGSNQGTVGETE